MKVLATACLAALLMAVPVAAQDAGNLSVLTRQDLRLAEIAERMQDANRAMCRQTMPLTGLVLHSQEQYRDAAIAPAFANGRIAVAAVVPGSPAAAAGIVPGDGLVAIGAQRADAMVAVGEAPLRDTALAALADSPEGAPVALTLARGGAERSIALEAPRGCRAQVEIKSAASLDARSDGKVIQVNFGLAQAASDAELAVVFAHEFAHLVLEHRRRLVAAGVIKGFFGEFGRNQRLNRQVEVEADRMTVHLLANAGYDPAIAPAFWRGRLGNRVGGGLMISATYPSAGARGDLIAREITDYLGGIAAPSWPGHLLGRRDTSF
jgi:hypothetical protein